MVVDFPKDFEAKGFRRCYSKAQFDYLTWEDYEKPRMYYDYKKNVIYFHEWYYAPIRDNGDYAWDAPYDYKAKVLNVWAN